MNFDCRNGAHAPARHCVWPALDSKFKHKNTMTVEKEGDESAFWIEMLTDAGIMSAKRLANLLDRDNH